MSTTKERKSPNTTKRIKKDALQKVIILTVDPSLDEKYANEPVSRKTEGLRNAFANSSL